LPVARSPRVNAAGKAISFNEKRARDLIQVMANLKRMPTHRFLAKRWTLSQQRVTQILNSAEFKTFYESLHSSGF